MQKVAVSEKYIAIGIVTATLLFLSWRILNISALQCYLAFDPYFCYRLMLTNAVSEDGPVAAQHVLFSLLRRNYVDLDTCAQLGHDIGRAAFVRTNNIDSALRNSLFICGGGYQDGVFDEFWDTTGREKVLAEKALECDQVADSKSFFLCIRAVGGEAYLQSKYDLEATLRQCEGMFSLAETRRYCAWGAFHKNVLAKFFNPQAALGTAQIGDPIAPCTGITDPWKKDCYWISVPLQVIRLTTDKRYEVLITVADSIPESDRWLYWHGIGREMAGILEDSINAPGWYCGQLLADDQRMPCQLGAAYYFASNNHGKAAAYCKNLPRENEQTRCLVSLPPLGHYPARPFP